MNCNSIYNLDQCLNRKEGCPLNRPTLLVLYGNDAYSYISFSSPPACIILSSRPCAYLFIVVLISEWPAMVCKVLMSRCAAAIVIYVCPYGILRTNRESLENQGFAVVRRVFILFQNVRASLKKSLVYWGCKMDDKRIRE